MAEPFLAEVRMYGFSFAPRGWGQCNGQILNINQNQSLFSLLGTTFGGNGQTTFALPDLRGRVPIHWGDTISLGQRAGTESHTLIASEMATHSHSLRGDNNPANTTTPGGNLFAQATIYSTSATTNPLASAALSSVGGNQPHENRQPYLVVNFCIALVGIFPSRN